MYDINIGSDDDESFKYFDVISEPSNHVCIMAYSGFAQSGDLNKHLRLHVCENPYGCEHKSCS